MVRIRRGLFATVPAGADSKSFSVDPFLVASKLTEDAVLAYHTALEFHGKAQSVHERFTYLASRPPAQLTIQGRRYSGVKFPQSLLRKKKTGIGVKTEDRFGLNVRVTSLERTLVDVLDRPGISGSWEEIWRSLESIEFLDVDQVVKYALLLENATTTAKVGFFLEQHREALQINDARLKPLRARRPSHPHYLERRKRESGRLIPGWNLIVPAVLQERSWAEVS